MRVAVRHSARVWGLALGRPFPNTNAREIRPGQISDRREVDILGCNGPRGECEHFPKGSINRARELGVTGGEG